LLKKYVVLPEAAAEAVALGAVLTYLTTETDILPILGITSPDKRCGKSLLLDLLAGIVHRHIPASNISTAALFRAVEAYKPCLLVDEADTFLEDNEELRGILNSGHRRSSAFVIRTVGDDHEARQFSTWGPKAIAKIGTLPATIEDRSIVVKMKRKAAQEVVERFSERRESERLTVLRRRCFRWAKDYAIAVSAGDPMDLSGLNDRANDNWRPLLSIADVTGGEWPQRAREAARILSSDQDENQPAHLRRPVRVSRGKRNRYQWVTVPDRKSLKTRIQWARYRWYRMKLL
jgi:putative DNA primase/helicase